MKKTLIALALIGASSVSMADTVRLSDGNSCSFDSDDTPWEMSFYGEQSDKQNGGQIAGNGHNGGANSIYDRDEFKVGTKLTYKFGGPKRLDCSRLYNIQLNTKNAELKLLEQKLQILQSNASINWD